MRWELFFWGGVIWLAAAVVALVLVAPLLRFAADDDEDAE